MLLSNVVSDMMLCTCSGAVIKVKCKARRYQPRRALARPLTPETSCSKLPYVAQRLCVLPGPMRVAIRSRPSRNCGKPARSVRARTPS